MVEPSFETRACDCILYSFDSITFTLQVKSKSGQSTGDREKTGPRDCGWLHTEIAFIQALVLGADGTTLPLIH